MNVIGRLGAWVVYFGVVGLVLILGWKEPLKNHFMPGNNGANIQTAQTAPPAPELTVPLAPAAPPSPPPPQAVNGQVESVDNNVGGNRRMVLFSTPAPTQSGQ